MRGASEVLGHDTGPQPVLMTCRRTEIDSGTVVAQPRMIDGVGGSCRDSAAGEPFRTRLLVARRRYRRRAKELADGDETIATGPQRLDDIGQSRDRLRSVATAVVHDDDASGADLREHRGDDGTDAG